MNRLQVHQEPFSPNNLSVWKKRCEKKQWYQPSMKDTWLCQKWHHSADHKKIIFKDFCYTNSRKRHLWGETAEWFTIKCFCWGSYSIISPMRQKFSNKVINLTVTNHKFFYYFENLLHWMHLLKLRITISHYR